MIPRTFSVRRKVENNKYLSWWNEDSSRFMSSLDEKIYALSQVYFKKESENLPYSKLYRSLAHPAVQKKKSFLLLVVVMVVVFIGLIMSLLLSFLRAKNCAQCFI